MRLAFSDIESFWSQEHTLSKMSPVAYCMHPKTELISWAIKFDNYPTDVIFGEAEIRRVAAKLDWSDTFLISHNGSAFDHMIHAWRMGIRPKMWGCTLAMARPIHAKTVGLSLAKLVQHYGIGVKQDAILHSTRGKRLADFTAEELRAMEVYNKADTEQCAKLFRKLLPNFTPDELWHIDCNIRMLVEPEFDLDAGLLEVAQSVNRSNKHKALLDLARLLKPEGLDWSDEMAVAEWVREQMASADKFAAVLENRGREVPLKRSKTNPLKQIPAIAKTDEAMEELLDDEDEVVASAARARLSAKSTQLDTRIDSFLETFRTVGALPVPAHYCGADTTGRDSGFMYNMLNLPRINKDKPKVTDALRNSVRAPKGKVIGVADLSGIELRVNHTLWQVRRSMENWKRKPDYDLYRDTAADMYTCAPEDVQKPQRQYAKVIELACLAEGALVLTRTGLKPIESVSVLDCVWDGTDWVKHEGVLHRGEREVWEKHGLAATPDHEVWTGASFLAWSTVCESPTLLQRALCSVNSPSFGGSASSTRTTSLGTRPSVGVSVGGRAPSPGATSSRGEAPGATDAQSSDQPPLECAMLRLTSSRAGAPGAASWPGYPQPSTGATTPTTRDTSTTEHGASPYATSGESASALSWSTSAQCPGGMPPGLTWTGSTTTAGTSQETFGLCLAPTTREIGEPSSSSNGELPISKRRSRVFDLANCGPRSRFAVYTDVGLLLVHNCGYQQGAKTFRHTARVQGGLRLTMEQAKQGVDFWRARYPEIAGYETGGWAICQESLHHIANGDRVAIDPWGLCWTEQDAIVLPSGRRIRYPKLRQEWVKKIVEVDGEVVEKRERAWMYGEGRNQAFIYGGKEDENIVQAMARDIIFPNAITFWKRTKLRPKHKVYDELVYLFDPSVAEELLAELQDIMRKPPPYWPDLVLWSEGDIAETYGAAK